ncbi:MAG TPA: flavodoxin reductase [Devosiaceae bacterium]
MTQSVRIVEVETLTPTVRRYVVEKPDGYEFTPGQATEVSIDQDETRDRKNPFTFTGRTDADTLEFVIKSYFDHENGVTRRMWDLAPGDRLLLRDVWGTIAFAGKGTFIAGGAGITPFIAILRDLRGRNALAGSTLIFSNRTEDEIILRKELEDMAREGLTLVLTVTDEPGSPLALGRVDEAFLKARVSDFSGHFYVCGPDGMVADLREVLGRLGVSPQAVVFEK